MMPRISGATAAVTKTTLNRRLPEGLDTWLSMEFSTHRLMNRLLSRRLVGTPF